MGNPNPSPRHRTPTTAGGGSCIPIYGWLPIYGADTRLPDVPGESSIDSSLNQAFLAAFRIEKGRFALEGGYLYAGLSGEAVSPILKLEVDTNIADLRAGFEVARDLYLEGGVRWMALDLQATLSDYPAASWEHDTLEPVVGFTYRPLVGKRWRFVLHGDVGGLVTDSTTATGSVKLEWQPAKHLMFVVGGTVMYLSTEGIDRAQVRDAGPDALRPDSCGVGIPF